MSLFFYTRQAIQEEREENFARAFNLYHKALDFSKTDKTKIRILSRKAWCQEQVGNHKEADLIFSNLTKDYPEQPESYLESGIYHIKLGDYKRAKSFLKTGIEKFPHYLEFYLTLAYILKETDRTNESIEILKKALIEPNLTNGRVCWTQFFRPKNLQNKVKKAIM